jgi:uncharacterized integral membrane protein
MKEFKPNQITAIILIFGGLFFIFYDVFALYFWGGEATISYVVNVWAWASPLGVFICGAIVGGLAVHFLKWAPLEKQVKDDPTDAQNNS